MHYRQLIYKEELEGTSLMIGLRYYLHIKEEFKREFNSWIAFGLSKLVASPNDPTVLINDIKHGQNLLQTVLHFSDLKVAPLPCMQLAMYSPMIVDSKWFRNNEVKQHEQDVSFEMYQDELHTFYHFQNSYAQNTNLSFMTLHGSFINKE